jgi:DNA-binding NarL/FixJ family response regulator
MSEPEHSSGSSPVFGDDFEAARLAALRDEAVAGAGAEIARQLNGPLTALLLYVREIKQHSHQLTQAKGSRLYLQQVVENALQQTERICAMMKQIGSHIEGSAAADLKKAVPSRKIATSDVVLSSDVGPKPLTRRECEVLNLISEGYSNKQGALRMRISPRTFESHRAEAMRKLGARNTAELVRAALKHPRVV